jgi:hypothetical protein
VAQGVNHLALLSDAGVQAQLAAWLSAPVSGANGASSAGGAR